MIQQNLTQTKKHGIIEKQITVFEQNRFGLMIVFIMVGSCVGSIAGAFLMQNNGHLFWLSICSIFAMGSNAVCIAQASGKVCVIVFYLSLFTNVILIFTHLS